MPCVASARVRCARCVWSFERVLRVNEPKAPRLRHSRGRALGVRGAPLLRARASPPLDRAPPRSRLAPSHARPAFSSQVAGARLEIDGRIPRLGPITLPSARTARARPARAVGEPAAREGAEARALVARSPPHRALTPPGARAAMPPPGGRDDPPDRPRGRGGREPVLRPRGRARAVRGPRGGTRRPPPQLDSDSWVVACGGLLVARRLAAHHPDALAAKLRDFLPRLRRLANNLRSSVARTAPCAPPTSSPPSATTSSNTSRSSRKRPTPRGTRRTRATIARPMTPEPPGPNRRRRRCSRRCFTRRRSTSASSRTGEARAWGARRPRGRREARADAPRRERE